MEQTIPSILTQFKMSLVNIAAHPVAVLSVRLDNANLVTGRDTEAFLVIWSNKADAFFCLFHVPIQILSEIAVDVEVVISLVGVEPHEIGIFSRIDPKAKLSLVRDIGAFGMVIAKTGESLAAIKDAAIPLIEAQSIYDLIKLIFELLCFQVTTVVCPCGVKAFSVVTHIATEVTNTSGLPFDLRTLGVAVTPLCQSSYPNFHIHYRSRSLSPFVLFADSRRRS